MDKQKHKLYMAQILSLIFKDKDHPCWADTAWILDVTGELPQKEESE